MTVYCIKVHDLVDDRVQAAGTVVLIDRVWPRGIKKEDLGHDVWLKDAAPSSELRTWFGHDLERFEEFSRRYHGELDGGSEDVDRLVAMVDEGDVTLLYAAADRDHNHARVLAEWLKETP